MTVTARHPHAQRHAREREILETTLETIVAFRRDLTTATVRDQINHMAEGSLHSRIDWAQRCLGLATKGEAMPWEETPPTTGPNPMTKTINTGSPLHRYMPTHLIPDLPAKLIYVSDDDDKRDVLVWDSVSLGDWEEAPNDLAARVAEEGVRILDHFQITYLPEPVTMFSAESGIPLRRGPKSEELYQWWDGQWELVDKALVKKLTARAFPGFQIPGWTAGEIVHPLVFEGYRANTFRSVHTFKPNLLLQVSGDGYLPDGKYLAHSAGEMARLLVWIGERWATLALSNPDSFASHPIPKSIKFDPPMTWEDKPTPAVAQPEPLDEVEIVGKMCYVFDGQALPLFGKALHDSRGMTDFRVQAAFKVEDQDLDEPTLARVLDALLATLDPEVWAPDITRVLKAMGCEEFTVETMTDVFGLADAMMEEEDC